MKKNNKCIDCGKAIYYESIRCKSCAKKGKLNGFYNKHHTKKVKRKMAYLKKDLYIGNNNPNYKTGKYKRPDGYIVVHLPKHPFKTKCNRVLEHRLAMEAYLNRISFKKWIEYGNTGDYPKNSRFLTKKEIVHHINGIKDDNRIKNLKLFKNLRNHSKFHSNILIKKLKKRIKYLETKLIKLGGLK